VLEIDGHPLIAYSIAFARQLECDGVIVSTDSEDYRAIARRYGATCPYLRGAQASSDTGREEDILADLAENLPRCSMPLPDLWVWLKPVNPFRSLGAVHEALALLRAHPDVDSVRLVGEADARLHWVNADGFLEPYGTGWNLRVSKQRRSDFPAVY